MSCSSSLRQRPTRRRPDVMFGGGVESLESYQDLFAPYTCADADAILPQYRAKDDIWTPFSSLPLVFVYNPKLVGAEEITGWADLLRPELAGKDRLCRPVGLRLELYGARHDALRASGRNG